MFIFLQASYIEMKIGKTFWFDVALKVTICLGDKYLVWYFAFGREKRSNLLMLPMVLYSRA